MRSISIFLVLFSFLASAALQAATYKWTDESGNVVYSQQPPKSGPYELIKGLKHSKTSSSDTGFESTPDSGASSEGGGSNKQSAQNDEINKQNCEAAKKNLDIYKVYRRVKDQDGKVTTLSDEERQKRIDEAESQIRVFCK